MADADLARAATVIALQQLVHAWAYDLDVAAGRGAAGLVTADCAYSVAGHTRHGRDAVAAFYAERRERLAATVEGLPTLRHLIANLLVGEIMAEDATATFNLLFFAGGGDRPHAPDPAAVSDVTMRFRRESGGWRIASFDSAQPFRRPAP